MESDSEGETMCWKCMLYFCWKDNGNAQTDFLLDNMQER